MRPFSQGSTSTPPLVPHAIEEAFERLKEIVDPADVKKFQSTTLQDVRAAARAIEEQLAARKSLRNIRRVDVLLNKLRLYSEPVEVLCNGTPFLPWIWAPIKLMLQLASQNLEILEKLLSAYADIASALPRMDRLNTSFAENPSIRYIISVIYADILEFHRRAYKFFRRRGWKNFFHSSWSSFGIRFKAIIDSLEKHSDWLDREANSIDIAEAKEWRRNITDEATIREQERSDAQFQDALAWLAIDDQEEELDQLLNRCQEGTCDWLFRQKEIVAWTGDGPQNPLLWLKGIPGSGKSILCSQLIQNLRQDDKSTVAFYICDSYTSDQIKCAQILKAISAQVLRAHRDMASYITGEFTSKGFTPSVPKLRQLLANLPRRSTHVIVDGLDEVADKEHKQIINELNQLIKAKDSRYKALISSREGGDISRLLKSTSVFSLSNYQTETQAAITAFVTHEIKVLGDRFDNDILERVRRELIMKAGGMFLWVQLVLATLDDVYSVTELYKAVDSLPKGLDGAYGRVIDGFKNRLSDSNKDKVTRILQWIAFTCRPLRTHELLDGATLHEGNMVLDETTKLGSSVLELCKPIIEEGPGGIVQFVHFSAKEFLLHNLSGPFLRPVSAHHTIALSCIMYLSESFLTFHPSISDTDMLSRLLKQCHSLQSYGYEFWVHHLIRSLPAETSRELDSFYTPNSTLIRQLQRILEARKTLGTVQAKTVVNAAKNIGSTLEAFASMPALQDLLKLMIGFRQAVVENCESQDDISTQRSYEIEHDPTHYSEIMHRYRDSVEALLTMPAEELLTVSDMEAITRFRELRGAHPFTCRYPQCKRNVESFASMNERDRHEATHYRQWKCGYSSCPFYAKGWKSARALKLHNQTYHTDYLAFPSFGEDSVDAEAVAETEVSEEVQPKEFSSPREYVCQGKLSSGKKWGCGCKFKNAAELKAHYRTPTGFECIKELYSETECSLDREDIQEPQKRYMFTSSCGGSLNSKGRWGCGRNFNSDQALHNHWQTSTGIRCRQPLVDEVEAKIADWTGVAAADASAFESPTLHVWTKAWRKDRYTLTPSKDPEPERDDSKLRSNMGSALEVWRELQHERASPSSEAKSAPEQATPFFDEALRPSASWVWGEETESLENC